MSRRLETVQTLKYAFLRLPVTCVLIMVSCFLYSLSIYVSFIETGTLKQDFKPGALHVLMLTESPDINGMISLWQGEWWRLTVSAFHHGNFLHLIMNVLAFWMLANLVEPKLGWMRYLAFCLVAATVSILPEAAIEHSAVGISGMIFALFGMILVIRRHDEDVAERMHPSLVTMCFASLFICIPLTLFLDFPFANGAHLMGLVYGAAVGWLCYDLRLRSRLASYAGLTVIHAGLLGLLLALMQPVWNGRYFAWRAVTETQSIDDWKKAVELDPSLEVGWRYLVSHHLKNGDHHLAWTTALKGARLNRSNSSFDEIARIIWREFNSVTDRAVALDELQQVFGKEEAAWIDRFQLPRWDHSSPHELAELSLPDLPNQQIVNLNDLLEVPANVAGITRPLPALWPPGTVDPEHPDSARLGTTL
ncbi:MAG: rhomboid family intramembrane serine protease [Planctomycetota bacterium]|nr:rhomboid family intramembrane serine protease [Planctomycetota bacterium]